MGGICAVPLGEPGAAGSQAALRHPFDFGSGGDRLPIGPELVAAVPALPQKTLKIVPAPLVETVPRAPPALETPNPTVECRCGTCGAVLMRGEEGKSSPLMILCLSCGSYNLTDA